MASNIDKDRQLSSLGEIELISMQMWFEGHTSPEIEKAMFLRFGEQGPKAATVRTWFAKGGKLKEIYEGYVETESKARNIEARNAFKAHLKNALRVLVDIMSDKAQHTPSRVKAAQIIVDRELGEPVKPIDLSISNTAREILKEAGLMPALHGGEDREDPENI